MTGFGEAVLEDSKMRIGFRIRGVNHKGLDVNFRMPFDVAYLEPQLRQSIQRRVFRGRLDIFAEFKIKEKQTQDGVFLDRVRLQEIIETAVGLKEYSEITGQLDINTLIRMPDLTVAPKIGLHLPPDVEQAIADVLATALERFVDSRIEEGRVLYRDFVARMETLEAVIKELEACVVERRDQLVDQIRDHVATLARDVSLDENRLYQEVVFQADRLDVTEELTRLKAHENLLKEQFEKGGRPTGKRLEFLLQEAMREVSTIGNKARSLDIAPLVVTLKTEFEKVREQVLNIE